MVTEDGQSRECCFVEVLDYRGFTACTFCLFTTCQHIFLQTSEGHCPLYSIFTCLPPSVSMVIHGVGHICRQVSSKYVVNSIREGE